MNFIFQILFHNTNVYNNIYVYVHIRKVQNDMVKRQNVFLTRRCDYYNNNNNNI